MKAWPDRPVRVPASVALWPLRNSVMYPGSIVPVTTQRFSLWQRLTLAVGEGQIVAVAGLRDPSAAADPLTASAVFSIGCAARIIKAKQLEGGLHEVSLHGICRIRIVRELSRKTHFSKLPSPFVRIECLVDPADYREAPAVARLKQLAERLLTDPEELTALRIVPHGGQLADMVATYSDFDMSERQALLETLDVRERVARTIQILESRHPKRSPSRR